MSMNLNERVIKCVVWDLDETLWYGILAEQNSVRLKEWAVSAIKELDHRGILNSIASRNDSQIALSKLEELGIREYFLCPQIHWGPKSESIGKIAAELNIAADSLAFVDDQQYELEEVGFAFPQVMRITADEASGILEMPCMQPRYLTEVAMNRRLMYQSDMLRNLAKSSFSGTQIEFLETLHMVLTISEATEQDLKRAEELTIRTHQMNTTGYTYSYQELKMFMESPGHKLYVASLQDKFGAYGTIGIALVECGKEAWVVKLLLMSCRVMSRGIGTVLLHYIMRQAQKEAVEFFAEFVPNDRNRMMYITYRLNGFQEYGEKNEVRYLKYDFSHTTPATPYLTVVVE